MLYARHDNACHAAYGQVLLHCPCCGACSLSASQCAPPTHPPTTFDCVAGFNNRDHAWSAEKTKWCCEKQQIGCPPERIPCSERVTVIVEQEQSPKYGYQYFLVGDQYYKWDVQKDQAANGYPKHWKWGSIPHCPDAVIVEPKCSPNAK